MRKNKLQIVKIGGNIINNEIELNSFLKDFSKLKGLKIIVHGGGIEATDLAIKLGVKAELKNGRRVTDTANLKVVTMVYAGLLNKNITAKLQQYNCNAIGLSGADANSILAHKRIVKEIDYGFAGDIDLVNISVLDMFLKNNITPVFCAITHNKKGQLLNTNADTIASKIAIAMSDLYQTELTYIFDLKGVLKNIEDKNSVIHKITYKKYEQLVDEKCISKGMLPKLHNCFNALKNGVTKVKIGNVNLIKKTSNLYTTLSLK